MIDTLIKMITHFRTFVSVMDFWSQCKAERLRCTGQTSLVRIAVSLAMPPSTSADTASRNKEQKFVGEVQSAPTEVDNHHSRKGAASFHSRAPPPDREPDNETRTCKENSGQTSVTQKRSRAIHAPSHVLTEEETSMLHIHFCLFVNYSKQLLSDQRQKHTVKNTGSLKCIRAVLCVRVCIYVCVPDFKSVLHT